MVVLVVVVVVVIIVVAVVTDSTTAGEADHNLREHAAESTLDFPAVDGSLGAVHVEEDHAMLQRVAPLVVAGLESRRVLARLGREDRHVPQNPGRGRCVRSTVVLYAEFRRGRQATDELGVGRERNRGLDHTRDEIEEAYLVWKLGGRALLHAMAEVQGYASKFTVLRSELSRVPRFIVECGLALEDRVMVTMRYHFDVNVFRFEPPKRALYGLEMGDVKTNERVQASKNLSLHGGGEVPLLGLCRHTTGPGVTTEADIKESADNIRGLDCGGMGSEMTVLALARNGDKNYKQKVRCPIAVLLRYFPLFLFVAALHACITSSNIKCMCSRNGLRRCSTCRRRARS